MKKIGILFLSVLVAVLLFSSATSEANNPAPPRNFAIMDGFLEFPLQNYTPYTVPISAVMDHFVSTGFNCPDDVVTAYTNEQGRAEYEQSIWSTDNYCGASKDLYGFSNGPRGSWAKFSVSGQYTGGNGPDGAESSYFLFYDGHSGYDYPAAQGTSVYSAAGGNVIYVGGSNNEVVIDHLNGYATYYLHLNPIYVSVNMPIEQGVEIGKVDNNGHLHFTVKKNGQQVNPYGWKGTSGQDPLQIEGHDNVCLWKMCQ